MSEFAARLIADLCEFSGQLLESGIGPRGERPRRALDGGTESVLLGAARGLSGLVPHLLDDLEDLEDPRNTIERRTATATRGRLSHSPQDWARAGGRVLPRRWLRTEPAPEPDLAALGWLLHLVERLRGELEPVRQRTLKYVDEARISRRSSSSWAAADLGALEGLLARVGAARLELERCAGSIVRRSGGRLFASSQAPSPFPRGLAWRRVRELAADIGDRRRTLAERIAALLGVAPEVADEPVLYQRWCGMRLIEGLMSLGWKPEGDFIGALYLAGHVPFTRGSTRIDLWVENRITRSVHASGFACVEGVEVTPDYMIVTPGAGGLDAFVLDPTKSTDDEVLLRKHRYSEALQGSAPAMVAGVVSGPRRPLRSWAAAPLPMGHCRLLTQTGSSGVVPMHPLSWKPAPLRAWLVDVDRHARAWG